MLLQQSDMVSNTSGDPWGIRHLPAKVGNANCEFGKQLDDMRHGFDAADGTKNYLRYES